MVKIGLTDIAKNKGKKTMKNKIKKINKFQCENCGCKQYEDWYCQACNDYHKRCVDCHWEKNCLEHY